MSNMSTAHVKALRLPGFARKQLETIFLEHVRAGGGGEFDFSVPAGEPALIAADSVSWRVFRNPVALLTGGIAAVLMEFAEPRVRSGVWDHTSFRHDPLTRMRRTGFAAMVTVYGPRREAERMIARVRRMHEQVSGTTPDGLTYRASDPELLRWVHATAAFGFLEAYHRYVRPLSQADRDRYYAENAPVGRLYGATRLPESEAGLRELFSTMLPGLEPSPIVFEFLNIMKRTRVLPKPLRPAEGMLLRAAAGIVPPAIREILDLGKKHRPTRWECALVRRMGAVSDRIELEFSPASQAARRVGGKNQM